MFEKLDKSGDGQLSYQEYYDSLDMIKTWGITIEKEDAVTVQ